MQRRQATEPPPTLPPFDEPPTGMLPTIQLRFGANIALLVAYYGATVQLEFEHTVGQLVWARISALCPASTYEPAGVQVFLIPTSIDLAGVRFLRSSGVDWGEANGLAHALAADAITFTLGSQPDAGEWVSVESTLDTSMLPPSVAPSTRPPSATPSSAPASTAPSPSPTFGQPSSVPTTAVPTTAVSSRSPTTPVPSSVPSTSVPSVAQASAANTVTDRHFVEGGLILFIVIVGFALLWFNGKHLARQRREKEAAAAASFSKQKIAKQEAQRRSQQAHAQMAMVLNPYAEPSMPFPRMLLPTMAGVVGIHPPSVSPAGANDSVYRPMTGSRWGAHAEPVVLAGASTAKELWDEAAYSKKIRVESDSYLTGAIVETTGATQEHMFQLKPILGLTEGDVVESVYSSRGDAVYSARTARGQDIIFLVGLGEITRFNVASDPKATVSRGPRRQFTADEAALLQRAKLGVDSLEVLDYLKLLLIFGISPGAVSSCNASITAAVDTAVWNISFNEHDQPCQVVFYIPENIMTWSRENATATTGDTTADATLPGAPTLPWLKNDRSAWTDPSIQDDCLFI